MIKDKKVVIHAKKKWNLFIIDLAAPGKVIVVIIKAIAIIKQSQSSHLVKYNKCIRIWHCQLAYASNA